MSTRRQTYFWVCQNERPADHPKGSCKGRGSAIVLEELKKKIGERGLRDRMRACGSTCMDICSQGVVVGVMPQNVFYGKVTAADVDAILDAAESGGEVAGLKLADEDFA